jgi:hypothetical protein
VLGLHVIDDSGCVHWLYRSGNCHRYGLEKDFETNKLLKFRKNRNILTLTIGYYRRLKISRYVFFYFKKWFALATIHAFKVEKWPIQYSHWSLYFIMDSNVIYIIEKGKNSAFKRYKNFGGKLQFLT